MRALTLHRPWARFVATGQKRIENRSWKPPDKMLGVEIAIHAGRTWSKEGAEFCLRVAGENCEIKDRHPEGVIGTALIVGWCDAEGTIGRARSDWDGPIKIAAEDRAWLFGPFGWILREAWLFPEPIPCRGFQGLWNLDLETHQRVIALEAGRRAILGAHPS